MWIRRRAVACAGGLIAIALMLSQSGCSRTDEKAEAAHEPGSSAGAQATAADTKPLHEDDRTISDRERVETIARAQVWRAPETPIARASLGMDQTTPQAMECRFRFSDLGGTTPKFHCVLESGKELRVKYGPGKEIPGEAAATRLLTTLGFAADTVTIVERLRCHGCPNEPFVTSKVVEATRTQPLYERVAGDDGYEDFEWVAVEQKLAARPIESEKQKGWAFFELDAVDSSKGGAPRAHVDALRLLAVFIAHWDNKPENQRLVCLTKTWPEGTTCREPFLVLQDVGSTFGPKRVDLAGWEQSKVWDDRAACRLSMKDMPYGGATFKSAQVSEDGRKFLSGLLNQLTDAQLTDLFTWARFDKPRSRVMDTRPVADWVRVFKTRLRQISEGPPCPEA